MNTASYSEDCRGLAGTGGLAEGEVTALPRAFSESRSWLTAEAGGGTRVRSTELTAADKRRTLGNSPESPCISVCQVDQDFAGGNATSKRVTAAVGYDDPIHTVVYGRLLIYG